MEDHFDRKISKEEAVVKPTRSFRYEDYNTRRVFLRSYPLQWDWSAAGDEKQEQGAPATAPAGATKNSTNGGGGEEEEDGYESCGRSLRRQVAVAVVEWGEGKLLLLRRVKKRMALYLLGRHYGRPALPFKSGGSCTAAMLTSR